MSIESGSDADLLRDLRRWLVEEPELRGRVAVVERDPEPGALGPVTDALQVILGAGGALATLATVLVAWLRGRNGEITVTLSRGDGQASVAVTAKGVKDLDMAAARALTDHLARVLGDADAAG
ncbi:hypothetical protein [Nonomuraea sp. NPDC049607]|uniref:effector-associated constant component EACC1 n=1 Tax=unclassified Nonomuraea TaxID=2593643 RepID=UPI0034352D6F